MAQMNLFTKRNSLTDLENKLTVTKGLKCGGRIDLEFVTGMYKVLFLK